VSEPSASHRIVRAAAVVMPGLVLSTLVGVARQILVARAFGTGADLDSFFAANRLPELLFNLMAGGALASAFIPTYTAFLTRDDRAGAGRLASALATWVSGLLLLTCALAAVFAGSLVDHLIAPYFQSPSQRALTVELLRILLLSPTLFALSGLVMAVLNAHQRFFVSALAPMFYPLGMILGLELLAPRMGIYGLAWGAVAGAAMHLLVQLPSLARVRLGLRPYLGWREASLREVGRLMAPRLVGQGAVQLNFLVNTIIASGQPEGSLAALTWGFSLMLMPEIAIAQASAIAALPTFSEQVSLGKVGELRETLSTMLRGVMFLSLPASIGLVLLRGPLVQVVFERGSFTGASTRMVAWALLFYAAGLLAHSTLEVLARAYYALHDTLTPVAVSVGGMMLNVGLSLWLARLFSARGLMPHGGLALANTLATFVEMSVLLWLLRGKATGALSSTQWRHFARIFAACLPMTAAVWGVTTMLSASPPWVTLVFGVGAGATVYWLAALALGAPEARSIPRLVLSRLLPGIRR
jgi:putative peptidoglycan lipid II flippase